MGTNRSAGAADRCVDCLAGLDHCHGTLVTHLDGALECTGADCPGTDPARHALRIGCAELADCGCTEQVTEVFTLAS